MVVRLWVVKKIVESIYILSTSVGCLLVFKKGGYHMDKPQIIVPEINMDLVRIRAALPIRLAELSRTDVDAAVSILQDWGDGAKPLKDLYNEVLDQLDAATPN